MVWNSRSHGPRIVALLAGLLAASIGGTQAAPAYDPQDPAPGTVLSVSPQTLPAPYASDSVALSPQAVPRPPDASPRAPLGWRVSLFADGLDHARWLATAPDGAVFLSQSAAGRVSILRDQDHDGHADAVETWAEGLSRPHGLAFAHGGVYIADRRAVWYAPYPASGPFPVRLRQVTPDGALGQGDGHWTRTLALSADQKTLYVAIGSRGNIDEEPAPRASIQAFTLAEDGQSTREQRTYASGLRNPVGLALHPTTRALWTVVNERDGMGDGLVPDYLAPVREGDFYGWPYSYLGQNPQPDLSPRRPAAEVAALVARAQVPPVLFASHSAPLGLVFDPDGNAIVALHGSWNSGEPRGYMVVKVPFSNGVPENRYHVLASGFRLPTPPGQPAAVWGRPVGLAWLADGALLVADDVGQTLWRLQPP